MKLIIIIILATAFFIVGCSDNTPHSHDVDAYTRAEIDAKDLELSNRISNLEASQLNSEDILSLSQLSAQENTFSNITTNSTNPVSGCPSDSDVNVKWFDALSNGDITQSQYQKIVDKYNDCHG